MCAWVRDGERGRRREKRWTEMECGSTSMRQCLCLLKCECKGESDGFVGFGLASIRILYMYTLIRPRFICTSVRIIPSLWHRSFCVKDYLAFSIQHLHNSHDRQLWFKRWVWSVDVSLKIIKWLTVLFILDLLTGRVGQLIETHTPRPISECALRKYDVSSRYIVGTW